MAELSTDVRIFLSSTFVDLKELRDEIARRLRDVFGAHLLIMETFGSDAAPPVISAIRHVKECDLFVGIYARRYGAVDPATGKSITELELDEAERSLSAGTLTDILLYWLDEDTSCPPHLCEPDAVAIARLKALREHSRQHTYTPFRDPRDLAYFVIRDVLAKIRHRLTPPSVPNQASGPAQRAKATAAHRHGVLDQRRPGAFLWTGNEVERTPRGNRDQPHHLAFGEFGHW
jgi:hypothetical protein